ncbi:MAG: hypothetical protein NTY19_01985 [Planctomycetota bacterium]|nr:hypothetical protein [Planctomycetota bacterium]
MQRRLTLLTALLLAAPAALPATAAPPAPAKPNVIYIMSDELGYYEPGFLGGRNIQTPNLDRLAAEGTPVRQPAPREALYYAIS